MYPVIRREILHMLEIHQVVTIKKLSSIKSPEFEKKGEGEFDVSCLFEAT